MKIHCTNYLTFYKVFFFLILWPPLACSYTELENNLVLNLLYPCMRENVDEIVYCAIGESSSKQDPRVSKTFNSVSQQMYLMTWHDDQAWPSRSFQDISITGFSFLILHYYFRKWYQKSKYHVRVRSKIINYTSDWRVEYVLQRSFLNP